MNLVFLSVCLRNNYIQVQFFLFIKEDPFETKQFAIIEGVFYVPSCSEDDARHCISCDELLKVGL